MYSIFYKYLIQQENADKVKNQLSIMIYKKK